MADDRVPEFSASGVSAAHIGEIFSGRLKQQISDRWTPPDMQFSVIEITTEVANKRTIKFVAQDLDGNRLRRFVRFRIQLLNISMVKLTPLQFTAECISPLPAGNLTIAPNPDVLMITSNITGKIEIEITDVAGGFNNFILALIQSMVEVGVLAQVPLFFDAV